MIYTVSSERTRYYQEAREGIYSGPTFILGQLVSNLPISAFSTLLSSLIIFRYILNMLVII
jgi:hypothetical protein